MSATSDTSRSGKRRGWLFKLGVALGVLVALLVIVYFVATSALFIKGVILPRVGSAMNSDVTARDVSLSPFSELVLQGFKVQPKGKETLFEADEIRARYSLMDIIKGKIVVQQAGVTAPVVTIVQNADGTSNLDPITKKGGQPQQKPSAPQPKEEKKSAPPQIDIKNIYLKNATVNLVQSGTNGARTTVTVSNFDFNIDQLQNGQPSKITYGGNVFLKAVSAAAGQQTTSAADAKVVGNFALKLSQALAPELVNGSSSFNVTKTSGGFANMAALAAIMECDMTMTEIRKVNFRLEQGGTQLAEVRVSGPFSMSNSEGHLKVELTPVDRRALNIVGGPLKIDFNKTAISSSNDIDIKQKGKVIAMNGQFLVNDFSATLTNGTTPTLNIKSAYAISLDLNNNSGLFQQLNVDGTQNQTPFLKVSLNKPMPISWGPGAGVSEEAALDGTVTNFNLGDWAAVAGNLAPAGLLDSTFHLISRKGGKELTADLAAGLHGLGAQLGTNRLSGIGVQLAANTMIQGDDVQIQKLTVAMDHDGKPAGNLDVKGALNSKTKAGQFVLQVADINQNLLGPILAPSLGGKQLLSASINGNITSTLGASNSIAVLGGMGISNLVVRGTNEVTAPAPISANFKVDLGMQQQHVDLRLLQIALSPTDRAKNVVDCKGQVDMSNAKAINANLTVQAESIDVTPFYNQFTGGSKPAATTAPAPQPAPAPQTPAPTAPPTEPAAMQLPVGLATINVTIGKFLLREIEITNWQTAVRVETNHITVNPFQLSLNGAPIKFGLSADVGVPGYRYQVSSGMDRVPLEPIANSFASDKPGTYKGFVLANVAINGAGITGPNLRSNLNGQISFSLTNAIIQVTNGIFPSLLQPIAVALNSSELLASPLNSVSSAIAIGQGAIHVQTMNLQSAAFVADVHGDIQIADVLTNSPVSLPVTFALSQSLAKKVPYLTTISDTNSAYVNIPDFVKLGGTLGHVETKANLSTGSVLGAAKAIGGKVGGAKVDQTLNALGGLFGKPASTNSTTNAPSTNTGGAVNQLIDIWRKK